MSITTITEKNFAPFFADDKQNIVPGTVACLLSHIGCIKLTKSRGLKTVLICENDCLLTENFTTIWQKIFPDISKTPWDMLYLGGKFDKKTKKSVSANISHKHNTSKLDNIIVTKSTRKNAVGGYFKATCQATWHLSQ